MNRLTSLAVLSILFLASAAFGANQPKGPKLPPDFTATFLGGGLDAAAMTAANDGRIFFTEKAGRIRVIKDDTLAPQPIITIPNVITDDEQGCDGIVAHPDFAKNGWIYVFYTTKGLEGHNCNRVSRFTIKGDAGGDEKVIWESDDCFHIHNGGGLAFGIDGKLLIASGEIGRNKGQELNSLQSKVIRLNDDGTIPQDNPFVGQVQGKYQAIYAFGFRQPFKMAVQPVTGRIYLDVVSNANNESIFDIKKGGNGGWPKYEGYRNDPKTLNPLFSYGGIGNCITGGKFCNTDKTMFPKKYVGLYFFEDYLGNWIRTFDPENPKAEPQVFCTDLDRPVDLAFAIDGSLYILNRGNGRGNTISDNGNIFHVRYAAGAGGSADGTQSGPAKLAFVAQPQDIAPGLPFPAPVKIALQDAQGKVIPTATAQVTLSVTSGGQIIGTQTAAAVAGVATFNDISVADVGKGRTLTATITGGPSVASAPFEVYARVASPYFLPVAGTYTGPIVVRIMSPTPGAVIRYTTDGTAPTSSSPVFNNPIEVPAAQKITAIAFKTGSSSSGAIIADYKINGNTPYGLTFRPDMPAVNLSGKPPATLSEVGIFDDLPSLKAKAGFVPYDLNNPYWADGALKQRWIGLPRNGKIKFATTGEWNFPDGTVLVQNLELPVDEKNPAIHKRLETRILVVDADGKSGFGLTYKWRADNSNADLVEEVGAEEKIPVSNGALKSQTWHYPGRTECILCHNTNAGFVLGVKTRELNGLFTYAPTKVSDNQLRTWTYLNMFAGPPAEDQIPKLTQLVKISDPQAPLEKRVRSYFDANCASCHRPGGAPTNWDARIETDLAGAGILNGSLHQDLGMHGAKVVIPRDLELSMMMHRLTSDKPTERMPPISHTVMDKEAIDVISKWIMGLPEPAAPPN